jgi:CDP-diacylglycerol--serine O-phosphatidyltransferase
MLGYWNKSVYITYLGAFIAIGGLLFSLQTSNIDYCFVGMIIAGVCDMFDGKVARHIKDRTDEEKEFGVQIDSLADVICFITIPALTLYLFGLIEVYHIALLALYVVCGIVRLGYFNVAMSDKDKAIACYSGLPVPMSVPIFGIVWLLSKVLSFDIVMVYTILVPVVGYLHISKIKIKKFTGTWFYIGITLISIFAIILGIFVL